MTSPQERLSGYLRERMPAAEDVHVETMWHFGRGASNVTLAFDAEVTCEGRAFTLPLVLRPERQEGILEPYDVERQYRVMRGLAAGPVPVPPVLWFESDTSVLGARFFVMQRVDGRALPLFWYEGQTPELHACAGALATVHGADWSGTGIDDGNGNRSPVERDLGAWRERAAHQGLDTHPLIVALGGYLEANEPPDTRLALLHGDPNPGNYLVRDGRVVAVLDWELAGLGDPRSDLGFYAALMTVFGGWGSAGGETALSEAYARVTGEALTHLDYFEALGLYKMAVVMSGWGRAGNGMTSFYGVSAIERRLEALLGPRWAG